MALPGQEKHEQQLVKFKSLQTHVNQLSTSLGSLEISIVQLFNYSVIKMRKNHTNIDRGTKDTGTKDTGTKDAGTKDTGTKNT